MSKLDLTPRIQRANELRSEGYEEHEIVHQLAEEYEVTTRQARVYVSRARKAWVELDRGSLAEKKAAMREWLRSQMDDAVRAAEKGEKGARSSAVRAADMLCKLDGLYEPEVHEIRRDGFSVHDMSPELQTEMRALAEKVKAEKAARVNGKANGKAVVH